MPESHEQIDKRTTADVMPGHWPNLPSSYYAGFSAAIFCITGLVVMTLGLMDIHDDVFDQQDPLWSTLIENLLTLSIAGILMVTSLWTWKYTDEQQRYSIGRWTAMALVFLIATSLWILGAQALQNNWKPWIILLNLTGIFLLSGLFLGLYESRWLELRAELKQMAYYDELTGQPSRRLILDALANDIQYCQAHDLQLGLLFIDLDGFKPVNDELGHACGDELLIALTDRIEELLPTGAYLYRFGGDEFLVTFHAREPVKTGSDIANNILQALKRPFALDGGETANLGASIGLAIHTVDGEQPNALIRSADAAMYNAKQAGGNRIQYARNTSQQLAT